MGAWFNRIVELIDKVWEWLIKFVTFGIWQDSVYQKLSLKNAVAYVTRVIYILINRFNADSLSNKAAALPVVLASIASSVNRLSKVCWVTTRPPNISSSLLTPISLKPRVAYSWE